MGSQIRLSLAVLVCLSLFPARIAPAANGPETTRYFDQAAQLVLRAAARTLRDHAAAIDRSRPVKLTYRLQASGALKSVKVTSGDPNSFLAQTLVKAVRSAKFPPIPKAVLKEQGRNWVELDFSFETMDNPGR